MAHLDRVLHDHRPITADIFLNNFCNNNCPYCTYKRWEFDSGSRYMTSANFQKYAVRLQELGVLGFILTGGGEPTISPDFDEITNWLEINNIHYGINTNFNVLKLIKPDYLKVSLDGYDSESYYNNRGVDKFDLVRSNIKKYAEWKRSHDCKTSLGIQILAKSVYDVEKFYENNKDLPVDYISIRPMESTFGTYYKTLDISDESKNPSNIIRCITNIASIDHRVILNYKWNLLDHQENSCVAQWAQIAVNEIGEVMYCCHKPYEIVGHVMDDDILIKKERAITNMRMCDIPCRMTAPNLEVARILSVKVNENFI